jgi:hypothetical protein
MAALAAVSAWRGGQVLPWVLGTLGGALFIAGAIVPAQLGPVQRAWMRLALAISKVTTPIIMGVLFFGVMTPFGLVARLFGHNALVRQGSGTSTWVKRSPGARRGDLERQF